MKKLSPTMKINLLIIVIFTSIQGCDSRKPTNDFTDNTNTELQCKDNALSDSNLDKLYSLTDEGLAQNLVSIGKTCKIEQKNNEKYFAALEKYISKASPKDLIELYKKYDQNNLEFLRYELLSRSNVLKFTNNNSLLPLQYKAIEFNSLGTEISKANLDNKELANIKT